MNNITHMQDVDLTGKIVLIREDLNVPIHNGVITSDLRLQAALPTIQQALNSGAKVMVMSHLGRPTEGKFTAAFSLQPIVNYLQQKLTVPVRLVRDYLQGVTVEQQEVVVLENVRFNAGEKKNDDALAQQLANLCDIFIMDAFGTAHRAQASTYGVAQYAKQACAGPLLSAELNALSQALENPKRPLVAIVGGSKVSTKLTILSELTQKVDQLIVGGGIANTFIAAAGYPVGESLYEADLIIEAQQLMATAQQNQCQILIPTDVVVGQEFSVDTQAVVKSVETVTEKEMIFDIGPNTVQALVTIIKQAGAIVWNGPVGVFEFEQFAAGTKALAEAIATSDAFSIAGGGDTLAAIDQYQIAEKISYISTGGGAFLEFLEGKTLPAVAILQERA